MQEKNKRKSSLHRQGDIQTSKVQTRNIIVAKAHKKQVQRAFSVQVNIKPVPQARPRFFVRYSGFRRFVGAYDPDKCKTYKEVIAWHARTEAFRQGLQNPVGGPISIKLIFQMGKNGKEVYHTKKPDIDNLAKAVKDALKGIIYADDSQIVEAHLFKQYGEPMVRIEIQTKI